MNNLTDTRYTPDNISYISDNEVFVFGSNLRGVHGAGTAKLAVNSFGAKYGQGIGLQGQSYAIPTKDYNIETLPLAEIQLYVNEFLRFAKDNYALTFLVTKIGCGLAGYTIKDIAPMFYSVSSNVVLPKEFVDFNQKNKKIN